jgi:hypothetical protein
MLTLCSVREKRKREKNYKNGEEAETNDWVENGKRRTISINRGVKYWRCIEQLRSPGGRGGGPVVCGETPVLIFYPVWQAPDAY